MQNAEGAILGPFDCWLAMRGLKTMALRMRRQAASAALIARWLDGHPLVRKVRSQLHNKLALQDAYPYWKGGIVQIGMGRRKG